MVRHTVSAVYFKSHTVYFKRKDDNTERVAEKLIKVLCFIHEVTSPPKDSKSLCSTSGSNWLPNHHSSLHLFS